MPNNVQQADEYYQQSSYIAFLLHPSQTPENLINLWGESPTSIPSPVPIDPHPLTNETFNGLPIGHSEVWKYYLSLLGTPDDPMLPPEITPFK